MSNKPLTIDNLGPGASSRYATDEGLRNAELIKDSRWVPRTTEVSVLKPSYSSPLQEYLLPTTLNLWASFETPPNYLAYSSALFSHTLIPSLGGSEKQESDMDKLEALEDALDKPFKNGREGQNQQEEEKERQTLLHLMKTLQKLDRTLSMINSRRNQYQRG